MRVLIISPHFPPVNAPDMQRVRALLPYLKDIGIDADVLAVEPDQVSCPKDHWLDASIPEEVQVHRVTALGLKWTTIPSLGTLGFRSLNALRKRGNELLRSKAFDLVFFSTTVFEVHVLGSYWKKKYGVPFVMDFQDPWVNDYYREHRHVVPPGGRLKYAVVDLIHRIMEPYVLRRCSGIITVSPSYPKQLSKRYDWLVLQQHAVGKPSEKDTLPFMSLPFPWSGKDLERVSDGLSEQKIFDQTDGHIHWVYTGVLIPGMIPSVEALFMALKRYAPESLLEKLRLHFVGTSYAPEGQAASQVEQLASSYGLEKNANEQVDRVPYSEVLACLRDADALMAFGSDDSSYTPSKIQPYLAAKKPLLAIYHENSPVIEFLNQVGGAAKVSMKSDEDIESLAGKIREEWLEGDAYNRPQSVNEDAFAAYGAPAQVQKLESLFSVITNP